MNCKYTHIFLLGLLSIFLGQLTIRPVSAVQYNSSISSHSQVQKKSLETIFFTCSEQDQKTDCGKNCRGTGRRD